MRFSCRSSRKSSFRLILMPHQVFTKVIDLSCLPYLQKSLTYPVSPPLKNARVAGNLGGDIIVLQALFRPRGERQISHLPKHVPRTTERQSESSGAMLRAQHHNNHKTLGCLFKLVGGMLLDLGSCCKLDAKNHCFALMLMWFPGWLYRSSQNRACTKGVRT